MTGTNRDRQAELLDDFWNALRLDETSPPPAALDTSSAGIVRELERDLHPDEPDARFVATLRAQLRPAPATAILVNGVSPALPAALTAMPIPTTEPARTDTGQRRGGFGREILTFAAASLAIVFVGTALVLLFRDRDPAGTPATEAIQPAALPPAEPIYQVAFSAYEEDGTGKQLLLANAGGSGNVPLTGATDTAYVGMSNWSPDGRFLAYIGGDGDSRIQILDVVTGEQRVLAGTRSIFWPRWSPDGTTVAFMGLDVDGAPDLFTVGANGGEPHNLTNSPAQELMPVWSPDGSMIAFSSDDNGNTDIYVIYRDGSDLRNVSNQQGDEFGPSWSPDGTRIAFNTHPAGNAEIFVADLTTSTVTNITNSPEDELYAVWSPDGSTIAYTRSAADDEEGRTNLWLMDADGTNRRELIPDDTYATVYATWSPDSERIAATLQPFERRDTVHWSLVAIDRDGGEPRVLSDRAAELDIPAWRPGTNAEVTTTMPRPEATPTSAQRDAPTVSSAAANTLTGEVLIGLRSDGGENRLHIMSADGTQSRQLIPEGTLHGQQTEGVWSPDGNHVAFTVWNESSSDIYVVRTDGSDLRQLDPTVLGTPRPNWTWSRNGPAWSPDGQRIAFSSNQAGDRGGQDIYVVNADGSNLQRLTDGELWESGPRWSPDGSMITYEVIGGSGDHYGNVYVMNADGSGQRRLVETLGAADPNWSPDGAWIAYSDGRFGSAVHIVSVDGTQKRDLSGPMTMARWPRWSPDGSKIAWSAHDEGGSLDGILVLDMTTGDTRLVSSATGRLEWSPDGEWLLVAMPGIDATGNPTNTGGLYVVRLEDESTMLLQERYVDDYDTILDWRQASP